MSRIIKNGLAVIRGLLFRSIGKRGNAGKINCGKYLLKYKDVYINSSKNSSMSLGNYIKINDLSTISVLNEGSMIIADGVGIGHNNSIVCHNSIKIGTGTILGPNVSIYDHDHIYDGKEGVEKKQFHTAPVSIGENCWIGSNVVILKGTTIGDRCVIGAGTILKGSYPNDSLIIQERTIRTTKIHRSD